MVYCVTVWEIRKGGGEGKGVAKLYISKVCANERERKCGAAAVETPIVSRCVSVRQHDSALTGEL